MKKGPVISLPLRDHDLAHLPPGGVLIGIDEAGRGALAGPVVAGAVAAGKEFFDCPWMAEFGFRIKDSKRIPEDEREVLFDEIESCAGSGLIQVSHGTADVVEIEQKNILGATRLAMQRALENLRGIDLSAVAETATDLEQGLFSLSQNPDTKRKPIRIIVDGRPLKPFPYKHRGIIKGDGKSLVIAMGSIIAKVTRDRIMRRLSQTFPGFGFDRHKGYATQAHREAILRDGPCPEHRPGFLKKLLSGK